MTDRLELVRGDAPLIVTFPHTGTELPPAVAAQLTDPWLARKDADHWVQHLYDFAAGLGATTLRTRISRSVIDVNRDPSGASLYPGRVTTELCPLTTFDGEALYSAGREPSEREIARRRALYFEPYHALLTGEIARLRERHAHVVLYDAHAIRSVVPRLFEGSLPELNLGNFDQRSCAPPLMAALELCCSGSSFTWVSNGRFKGGWTTRHYGRPEAGVHAVQMELAMRAYLDEPTVPDQHNWPTPYSPARAAALVHVLRAILQQCLDFASQPTQSGSTS